jgi:hypothetical protein
MSRTGDSFLPNLTFSRSAATSESSGPSKGNPEARKISLAARRVRECGGYWSDQGSADTLTLDEVGGVGTKVPITIQPWRLSRKRRADARAAALCKPTCHRLLRGGGLDVRGLAMSPPEARTYGWSVANVTRMLVLSMRISSPSSGPDQARKHCANE